MRLTRKGQASGGELYISAIYRQLERNDMRVLKLIGFIILYLLLGGIIVNVGNMINNTFGNVLTIVGFIGMVLGIIDAVKRFRKKEVKPE